MGSNMYLVGTEVKLSCFVKCKERKTTPIPSKNNNDFKMPIKREGNFGGKRGGVSSRKRSCTQGVAAASDIQ